jgi:hypothetical protein
MRRAGRESQIKKLGDDAFCAMQDILVFNLQEFFGQLRCIEQDVHHLLEKRQSVILPDIGVVLNNKMEPTR